MREARLIRVVDDDPAVSDSLCRLLESWGLAVETFGDGEAALAAPCPENLCCILLDVRLPGRDGLSILQSLRQQGIETPVIILTGHGDVSMAVRAMRDGAQDFIEKPFDDEDLVEAIERVSKTDAVPNVDVERFAALTPRETDVMREVVAGHANKVIAHRLGLSPRTIEVHRARVMEKTGAESLSHLVRLALKAGYDPDADPVSGAG